MSLENKGSIAAQVLITAEPDRSGNFVCDGTSDETEINLAFGHLTSGRTGKERVKLIGDFTIDGTILVPSYTVLDLREARIFLANTSDVDMIENDDQDAGNTQIEILGGILDGNKANQSAGNGIHFLKATHSLVEGVTVLNADDDGIRLEGTTTGADNISNVITNCRVYDSDQDNIVWYRAERPRSLGNYSYNAGRYGFLYGIINFQGVFADEISYEATSYAFAIQIVEGILSNCTAYGAGQHGFYIYAGQGLVLDSCSAYGNTQNGIRIDSGVTDVTISDGYYVGNSINNNNTYDNLSIIGDDILIVNNIMILEMENRPRHGVYLEGNNCVIEGNYIDGVRSEGIHLEGANNCIITDNRIIDCGTYAIELDADSDENYIANNYTSGSTTGCVNVANANCNDNNFSDGNNFLEAGFVDGGTGTMFQSQPFQFIKELIGDYLTSSPTGIEIDANTEGAILQGHIPQGTNQVMRLRVHGVALDGPIGAGGQMHLEFTFNSGVPNAAYNTAATSWTLADHDSEEADYVANDVITWVVEDADVGSELAALAAGNWFDLIITHEAGSDPDGATDAVFGSLALEYV